MALSSRRHEVLKIYKLLHRTKQRVFKGDTEALTGVGVKINEEFKKNKGVTDPEEIEKMLKLSRDVEHMLRISVVQAIEKKPGTFELQMRPEIKRMDNIPFPGATEEFDKRKTKCCQEKSEN